MMNAIKLKEPGAATPMFPRCLASVVVAAWCLTSGAADSNKAAAATATPSRPATAPAAQAPRSLFVDDPQRGKDPFFPQSARRSQTAAPVASNAAPIALPTGQFILRGLYNSKSQPLAQINNLTLGVGETGEVRVGPQVVKIKCREIRVRSVLIEIEGSGEVRELKLRDAY